MCMFAVLIFSGCAVKTMTVVQPEFTQISVPPLNTEVTKSVGEELMSQGRIAMVPALELLNSVKNDEAKAGIYKLVGTVKQNKPGNIDPNAGKLTDDREVTKEFYQSVPSTGAFISPFSVYVGLGVAEVREPQSALIRDNETGEVNIGAVNRGSANFFGKGTIAKTGDYKLFTYPLVDRDNFQQSLIYTGKQGNTVKFLYREYKEDMARPAFSVEVTYDLNDGSEVAFKNARLKVIKATNASITYSLINNFN